MGQLIQGVLIVRTKIPAMVAGLAGIAVTAALALPAAAAQPSSGTTTTATTSSKSGVIELRKTDPVYRVRPGESLVIEGPCGSVGKNNFQELLGDNFDDPGRSFVIQSCQGGYEPVWHSTVMKDAHNGNYFVSFTAEPGATYDAVVTVVGGTPVTPPTQPTSPTQPTAPTQPTTPTSSSAPTSPPASTQSSTPAQPSQQIPVKPKGAPQTGGGGMADVVSTWG